MTNYLSIIKSSFIGIFIAGAIFYWGFINDGYIRMGIAILILLNAIKSALDSFDALVDYNLWLSENQEKIILFYPTQKPIQEKIKSDFIPLLPFEIFEVYYDGPKLTGDAKKSIVLGIMKWNPTIKINEPSAFKIVNKSVLIAQLPELKNITTEDIDYHKLIDRVEKIWQVDQPKVEPPETH